MRERLLALAAFLPLFEEPGFVFGFWHGGEQVSPGVLAIPYFSLGATASSFVHMAYDQGWVLTDFNWPAWKGTEEAITLRDNPAALEKASPDQLAKLLTVVIRQDRFAEGALNSAFESGLLTAIARRAAALVEQDDKGS
jgi:hypothetical protein